MPFATKSMSIVDENPTAYTSLWEQLEKIVNEKREARVSAASTLARLEDIAAQVSGVRAGGSGLSSSLTGTAGRHPAFHRRCRCGRSSRGRCGGCSQGAGWLRRCR